MMVMLHVVVPLIIVTVRDIGRFLSLAEARQSIVLGGGCIHFALALVIAYVCCAARASHSPRLLALPAATTRSRLRARALV